MRAEMKIWEYAMFRSARQLMTPDELARAEALAQQADANDYAAYLAFQRLAMAIIGDQKRRKPSANKK